MKQPDEIELARMEIISLVGNNPILHPIMSSIDLFQQSNFSYFTDTYPEGISNAQEENLTFQRYVEYQSAYRIQGFLLKEFTGKSIDHLIPKHL